MARLRLAAATGAFALQTLAVQTAALLSLAPNEFGLFSIVYLAGAFVLSIQLSLVGDAWVRRNARPQAQEWLGYSSASTAVAFAGGIAASAVTVSIPGTREIWWLAGIAVFASTLRAGARYFSLRRRDWSHVLIPDVAGVITALASGVVALVVFPGEVIAIFIAWALTSVVSAACSRLPRASTRELTAWFRTHREQISPLIRDSLLQDLAAVGTPYLLLPLIGVANFGVYRAVSNVAAPVRLLLSTLRPALVSGELTRAQAASLLRKALLLALVSGTGAGATLYAVDTFAVSLGTLSALAPFAAPVGLFVACTLIGTLFIILGRTTLKPRQLAIARYTHTALAAAIPIGGALASGLSGAIWGVAIATLVWAAIWVTLVVLGTSEES